MFLFFYVISFNGLIFGAGIFLGFDLFPIRSSPSLEDWSTPWAHDLNILCLASDSVTNKFMMVS